MKKIRIDVGHRAVPRGYEPGYPARLEPGEFKDAIENETGRRVRRVLATLGAAMASSGLASAQDPGKSREDRVLEVLRKEVLEKRGGWLERSSFEPAQSEQDVGYKQYLPRVPIMFGNSYSGVFDAGEARRHARTLFEAYGIKLDAGVVVAPESGRAVLDGCDREKKIGFKLRGGALEPGGMGPKASVEPADSGLSDAELASLRKHGYRLHVADHNQYPVMDHDVSPPMFAYLASIVDFLNAVTDGPDIDLTAVMVGWTQRLAIQVSDVSVPQGAELSAFEVEQPPRRGWRFKLPEAGRITIEVTPRPAAGSPALKAGYWAKWRVLDKAISTAGQPTMLKIGFNQVVPHAPNDSRPTGPAVSVVQSRGDGKPPIEVSARSAWVLMPSMFDAARPFTITIEAGAFPSILDDSVMVSVMPN